MGDERRVQLLEHAVSAACDDDVERAGLLLGVVLKDTTTPAEAYTVCWWLGLVTTRTITEVREAQGLPAEVFWAARLDVGADSATQFATRFVNATGNEDADTARSLVEAACNASRKEFLEAVTVLFSQAVKAAKLYQEETLKGGAA